jgi:outer membrane protein OmpA-like peptidoglycan-associated protein
MKLTHALGAFLLLSCASPALAQSYPGEEITVNPAALGHGYLLYPGGKYGRNVGNLLQPGTRRGDLGVIHLHMPVKHPRVARAPRPAPVIPPADTLTAPDTTMAEATPQPPTPVPPKPHKPKPAPVRTAAATPPPAATPAPAPMTSDPNALPEDSAARLMGLGTMPGPAKPAKPPKPTRTASATPPPANTTPPPAMDAGLKIQATVPFAVGASSPVNSDVNAVHALATSLTAALNAGASRVQLQAYGGPKGDKGSESRRLSLKRALVIRELLIEDGVPSEKIDVRAMGGSDDNGAPDRVDVYLRS